MNRSTHHGEAGTLLIVVLVVCTGLVSIVLLFAETALMNYRGTENTLAGHQAEEAVEAGGRYASYLIGAVETKGTMPDPTSYQFDELPVGEATFWYLGRPTDDAVQTEPAFGLVDEASKLNLNDPAITDTILLNLPGMTQELASAIVSWRDKDGSSSSDTYGQRQPSYHRKAAAFESDEELALVDGADLSVLGGRDLNRNGVLDSDEYDVSTSLETMGASTTDGPGVLEYLTAFSQEANPAKNADGEPRPLANSPLLSDELKQLLRTKCPTGGEQAIALLTGQEVKSALEFFMRSQLTPEEFDAISGELRFSEAPLLHPVNVNTASATVLGCLPGLTQDIAQEIVAARASRTTTSTSISWVAEYIKDPELAAQAGPFLTGKTSIISADVAAVGRNGRGYRRTRFVFDASGTTPKTIYRRNLGSLGWALGRNVRYTVNNARGSGR